MTARPTWTSLAEAIAKRVQEYHGDTVDEVIDELVAIIRQLDGETPDDDSLIES